MPSVLDQMTADVTSVKQAAALTPVGTEKRPIPPNRIPDVPNVFLTQEALADIAKDLRRQAQVLVDVADGLDEHIGKQADAEAPAPDVKAAEREADERATKSNERTVTTPQTEAIIERMRAIKDVAQAAVLGDVEPERTTVASGSPVSGWECPEHGSKDLRDLTSNRGRKYRACGVCTKFEK